MAVLLPEQLEVLLDRAARIARDAATVILPHFRSSGLRVETKADGSPVTQADRAAETFIREALAREAPEFDVLGEEEGLRGDGSRLRWMIDPIDGTISFSRGLPFFGTLLALWDTHEERGLVGVLHLPALGRTYRAARGLGCHEGERRLRLPAAGPTDLGGALLSAADPRQFVAAGIPQDHARAAALSPLFRGYADCHAHTLVLEGGVDAMIDPGLSPWDIGPLGVLVEEAGGRCFRRPSPSGSGQDLVTGRPAVVDAVVRALGWD